MLIVGTVILGSGTGCQKASQSNAADTTAASSTTTATTSAPAVSADRGKYLVTIGGCNDCHTPWKMGANGSEPDMSRMLSGHPEDMKMPPPPKAQGPWVGSFGATMTAWSGPWGVSLTRNLNPDSLTGIGTWTEELFIKTIRTGKHWGTSRPIMPPMPWPNYAQATDDDLKSIYAYLRTVPAIKNQVPDYIPPAGASTAMAPTGTDTAKH
jgi:mono/diheme cytochrome c family protein